MNIDINLLPRAHFETESKRSKLFLLNNLSIVALVILTLITAGTFIIRATQKSSLDQASQLIQNAEAKLSTSQDKEIQLLLLKNRLDQINKISGVDIKRKEIFSLIIFLAPSGIEFNDLNIGRDGGAVISASSSSLDSIDQFISSLSDKQKNAGTISKVTLDGLTLGKNGVYQFSMKVFPK